MKIIASEKQIGISYLSLGIALGAIIFITWTFIPANSKVSLSTFIIGDKGISFLWVWLVINVLLSLYIGVRLIINKMGSDFLIFGAAIALVILDCIPIFQAIGNFLTMSHAEVPWTVLIFIIHLYLLHQISLLSRKVRR